MLRQISSKVLCCLARPHSTSTTAGRGKWNLVSSICLQRKPILTKEMNDIEKQVQKLLLEVENEKSWKSDWELQIEKDLKDLKQIEEATSSKVGHKLCRDWEDEWKAELTKFYVQPRLTEADKNNDVTSWFRLLDNTLVLVVQQTNSGNRWILPHGGNAQGETMRQTAERVLRERCGEDLKVQFYGNAPCGFFKYKYPKALREKLGFDGDKVFFYKAYLTGGELKSSSVLKEFKWVTRNQLSSTLPPDYCRSVEMFLFDENH